MLLLNVKAIVDRDTDINLRRAVPKTKVLKECDDTMTPYAILSHRWQDEVGYNEMIDLTEMEEAEREDVRRRSGYEKILRSCKQAKEDGLEWLWVDTCCIDKRSSSALSEAINSMYRWYENSTKCYAYLYDIDGPTFPIAENLERYGNHKGWPEWFSRGWTLQELIAPRDVQFFNKEWVSIGNKRELADTLEKITRISRDILISGMNSGVCSVAQIMSWAADRETTLVEDRAYSLLGLFGVHMPMVYGEGKKAFQRLQLEIIRLSNDHSIFAWDPEGRIRRSGSILADDPSYFRDCDGISSVEPNRFVQRLKSDVQHPSVAGRIMPANLITSAVLAVRRNALVRELSTCSIASGGLQISLPVVPYPGSSSRFRATLGCVASPEAPLMTIDLGFDSTRYFRFFGATEQQPTTLPRVKPLFLSYYQDESRRNLTLDDRTVSFYGFTRYGTFPRDIIGNSVKLLLKNDLIVVIYANDKADVRFAVGFGYYLGSPWTHVVYDECSGTRSWRDYAEEAYDAMWNRQPDLVSKMPVHNHKSSDTASFIKHVHLPRSIWAAKVMQGIWNQENRKVTIDVVLCSGCCHGPLAWELSTTDWNGVETPGPMRGVSPPSATYDLYMDGVRMRLLHFPNFQIKLGDYGRCNPTFEHDGNIFEGVTEDPAYDPVEHKISSDTMAGDIVTVLASGDSYSKLDLSHPAGRSLPNNQQLVSLLKTLSPRLVDNCLVTSVVYCATQLGGTYTPLCYLSIPQVWRRDAIDEKRQALFKEIREHFYTLLNWSRPTAPTGDSRSPNGKTTTKEALKHFSDLFGIEYLEGYVGKITFFKKLSTDFEHSPDSETSKEAQASINILAKRLHRRMDKASSIPGQRMQGVKHEIGTISKTLGIRLLEEMRAAYIPTYDVLNLLNGDLTRHWENYDLSAPITTRISSLPQPTSTSGRDSIRDMVQEIKTLQTSLDAVENIDEQLALEEDITGRILWTCHSGLRSAVGHIPTQVLNSILKEDKMYDLADRVKFLEETLKVLRDALAELPTDDQSHLRRIMADAEAGTSKHQLLLDERTRGQRAQGATHEGQATA